MIFSLTGKLGLVPVICVKIVKTKNQIVLVKLVGLPFQYFVGLGLST